MHYLAGGGIRYTGGGGVLETKVGGVRVSFCFGFFAVVMFTFFAGGGGSAGIFAALLGCILTSAFLPRPLEWLLGNRLMRRLSGLTFNFYIWHQFLAVQYVRNWFPNTLHSDPGLQWAFTVLCYASTLVLAAALTEVTDRVADWGKTLWKRKK